MAEAGTGSGRGPRRLTVDFAGWLDDENTPDREFFQNALIVLDANVLLELYDLGAEARRQVMATFSVVRDRLWVPHQAALEFSRRRKDVVKERISSFKRVRQTLRDAVSDAVKVLERAVDGVLELRGSNRTSRTWDRAEVGLDRQSLEARLAGVMDRALEELGALEAEHDLQPKDMQQIDALLSKIDILLEDRIGPAYPNEELRTLVEDAASFRYPNEIPPGYLDAGKRTPLRAAGDYLLWRQVIDRASVMAGPTRRLLLITNEVKSDWWDLDEKKRRHGPRPELVQELRDSAGADLLLLTFADFLEGTKEHLASTVSDETVEQLRRATPDIDALLPAQLRDPAGIPDLLSLSYRQFEDLIQYLVRRMGYDTAATRLHGKGVNLVVVDSRLTPAPFVIVEAKRTRRLVPAEVVMQSYAAMLHSGAHSVLIFATAPFSRTARDFADEKPIELIDDEGLLAMLFRYTGIDWRIGNDDEGPDGSG